MIDSNQHILAIGRRNSGKSFLIQDYLYENRDQHFKQGLIISPTDRYNHSYSPHISTKIIYDECTSELLANFRQQQQTNCQNNTSDAKGLIILDDCVPDNQLFNDKNLIQMISFGKYIQTTVLLTLQYPMGVSPRIRSYFNWIFLGSEIMVSHQKKLYEYYGGMFPTFAMFQSVLKHCTRDFGYLVINNHYSNSDKLEDQVFWYRVDINQPNWSDFKINFDNV